MYFFSIKNEFVNIIPRILGGVNNLKIIGVPTINNTLRIVDRSILKIKDIFEDSKNIKRVKENFILIKLYKLLLWKFRFITRKFN